jgi:glycosyltransferase involved in cell wall biosynthesis
MRILHVSTGLVPGSGVAEVVSHLALQQVACGHAVTIASLKGVESAGVRQARDGGVEVVLFGRLCGYVSPGMLFGLGRLLRRADVVHLHGNWTFPVWVGCGCALASGKPYVVSPHGSLDPVRLRHSAWKKRLAGLMDRYFLRRASVIHATSEAEAVWVRDYLRLDAADTTPDARNSTAGDSACPNLRESGSGRRAQPRIVVIPNGVDLIPWDELRVMRLRQGDDRKTSDGINCIRALLYLGRLHPLKGLDLLFEAWARVRQTSGCLTGDGGRETVGCNAETQRRRGEEEFNAETQRRRGEGGGREMAPTTPELPNSRTIELPPHAPTPRRWRLVIAGPDEQGTLAALERQARRLGLRLSAHEPVAPAVPPAGAATEAPGLDLDPTIIYVGPRYGDEKLRLLREADLVVLPSRSENFGLVVAEALAAGVPVVTTKAAPWAELLGEPGEFNAETQRRGERDNAEAQRRGEEGNAEAQRRGGGEGQLPDACFSRCGWWVEVGAEPLAEALGEAMSLTDEDRRLLGANGHRLVEAKYRWEAVAEQVVEAYRQVRGEA